jgi:hypothetical protein
LRNTAILFLKQGTEAKSARPSTTYDFVLEPLCPWIPRLGQEQQEARHDHDGDARNRKEGVGLANRPPGRDDRFCVAVSSGRVRPLARARLPQE